MLGGDQLRSGCHRATFAAFLLMVTIVGGNMVAIRYVSCEGCELDPFWAAGSRFLFGGVFFAAIALAIGAHIPRGLDMLGAMLYGVLTFGGGFGFTYWGLVHVPAGLGTVMLATAPLLTFILALAQKQERFRWEGLVGAALAVGGIGVVFRAGIDTGAAATSLLALIAAAGCLAQGAILVKRFPGVHPTAMNTIGMCIGATILLVLAKFFDEAYVIPASGPTWVAQSYLVIIGTVGPFALYLFVLSNWTASATSYDGVLIPLVAIILSVWLQDERITAEFVGGSILVVIGVYVGVLRRPSDKQTGGRLATIVQRRACSRPEFGAAEAIVPLSGHSDPSKPSASPQRALRPWHHRHARNERFGAA